MQGLSLIKTCLFRFLASVLLAISAGFVIVPDSDFFSTDKTYVKSHAPVADSFALLLKADDKEDTDEDGAIEIQLSAEWSSARIALLAFEDATKIKKTPMTRVSGDRQVYIFNRSLII